MGKYEQIIEWIFNKNYHAGDVVVRFGRDELVLASSELGFARIKNLGDIPYSFRFRRELPETIRSTAPKDAEWIIVGMGVGDFTGLTCYSIQNHLRTTVTNIGQVEVDEIYMGVNRRGTHFVLPCQAKSPGDRFGIVQVMQDIALCDARYPMAICRPIALQFTGADTVAILELIVHEKNNILMLNTVDEKHYQLVPRAEISNVELTILKDKESEVG